MTLNTASKPSSPESMGRGRRILTFLAMNPVTRIIVGFLAIGLTVTAVQQLLKPLRFAKDQSLTAQPLALHWVGSLIVCGAVVGVYALFVRLYEKRWPRELNTAGLWSWLPVGFGIGAALITSSAVLIRLGGWSVVDQVEPSSKWAGLIALALGSQLAVACFEEVLIRGILFRILEDSLGSWWALSISAVLFGLLHLGNDNATLVAALGLSLQAGVLLSAAFVVSRSLWLPIGIHWAWNGIQAGVVGGALSGNAVRSIISTSPSGPDFLSGGSFGLEGSLISTVVCLTVAVGFCVAAVRSGKIRYGFWTKRTQHSEATPETPSTNEAR